MNDELDKNDYEQHPEYDTSDAEVPFVQHHIPASLDHEHSHGGRNHAKEYIDKALHWSWIGLTSIWKNILWNRGFWTFAATITIATATVLYTYYARKQLRAITDQLPDLHASAEAAREGAKAAESAADTSKEALHAVQRAFITFSDHPDFNVFPLGQESVYEVEMGIQNVGATPAIHVKDRTSCVTPMAPLSAKFTYPDQVGKYCGNPSIAHGVNVISAKDVLYTQGVLIDPKMLQEFVQQNSGPWKNGNFGVPIHPTRLVIVYGWLTYRDIFKDSPEHLTEFCRSLMVFGIINGAAKHQWQYCPAHNCTDEDCPDYKQRIQIADAYQPK